MKTYSSLEDFNAPFELPKFASEEEAAHHAIDVFVKHREDNVYAYFVSGGPMHPCPPQIAKAIYDGTGVFVFYTAGCEHVNYESTFNAIYNAVAERHWFWGSQYTGTSPAYEHPRRSLIQAFMSHYYSDCAGDILYNPKDWVDKYLVQTEDGPYDFEREAQLRDLSKK
jgi:hypothetical protein